MISHPALQQVRLLTLVSALCVLDAVVRRNPPHSQNDLSRVYSGALRPDARSGAFAVLSELPLSDPHAQEIRHVIDVAVTTRGRIGRGGEVWALEQLCTQDAEGTMDEELGELKALVQKLKKRGSRKPRAGQWLSTLRSHISDVERDLPAETESLKKLKEHVEAECHC
eukprot:Skav224533  [mRNA]  locus=scaffold388:621105:624340:+ [translate_table: standard]